MESVLINRHHWSRDSHFYKWWPKPTTLWRRQKPSHYFYSSSSSNLSPPTKTTALRPPAPPPDLRSASPSVSVAGSPPDVDSPASICPVTSEIKHFSSSRPPDRSSSKTFHTPHSNDDSQVITVDPDFCSPDGVAEIKLTGTPFDFSIVESYTFYNCSSQISGFTFQTLPMLPFPCLGSLNHSVFAVRTVWIPFADIPASCDEMATISVPTRRFVDIRDELTLMWFTPFCRSCEADGRTCGLKSAGGDTVCFGSSRGIPRSAKYGLSIGIGVPALVCIIGLVCYAFGKARNYNHGQRQNIDLFSIAITPQPPSTTGLDVPTIESYPKTILGESCRLPKDDDGTCPICLSDYEPKEVVRTIPECKHYFHADCIDEWLKLNATCPVCRKSPESSSLVTPCSSMSSNSSDTPTE